MKSNKKKFGRFFIHLGKDGNHILFWTKKKLRKRWKMMYVARTHESLEESDGH